MLAKSTKRVLCKFLKLVFYMVFVDFFHSVDIRQWDRRNWDNSCILLLSLLNEKMCLSPEKNSGVTWFQFNSPLLCCILIIRAHLGRSWRVSLIAQTTLHRCNQSITVMFSCVIQCSLLLKILTKDSFHFVIENRGNGIHWSMGIFIESMCRGTIPWITSIWSADLFPFTLIWSLIFCEWTDES